MMTRNGGKNRDQLEFTSLDELVPEDHLVRKLENAIDWSFIYEMVADSYCEDNGRPSLDPVILIKLPVVQYMFGIRSMRQTIQEIKVNNHEVVPNLELRQVGEHLAGSHAAMSRQYRVRIRASNRKGASHHMSYIVFQGLGICPMHYGQGCAEYGDLHRSHDAVTGQIEKRQVIYPRRSPFIIGNCLKSVCQGSVVLVCSFQLFHNNDLIRT